MNRRRVGLVSGVWVLVLLVTVFGIVLNVPSASGQSGTIYIRADGSIDPPTAPIFTLDNVTYTFSDNINDSIMVERNNVVIDGNGNALQGMESGMGFYLSGINNVTIKNTEIKAFGIGIKLDSSTNNTISGNSIANNDYGIYFDSGTSHNSVIENIFVNDGLYVWGSTDGNVVIDNSVNGKPLVYLEDISDIVVEDAGQVILVDCTRIRVENLSLSNTVVGVYLCKTSYTTVIGNHITNNSDDGIWLYESSNNSITGNNISNDNDGIYLFSSSDNTIGNNTLMSNRWRGISVGGANVIQLSSNNTIINNTVTGNVCGFQFWGGGEYYNTVMNNEVHSNGAGIQLGNNAKYNTFIGNTISNNEYGITLNYPSNNKLYHNSFIDNAIQIVPHLVSIWDDGYPSGGNYWSNYTGVDLYSGPYQNVTGNDGIGDSPHVIDVNNQDRYPLMGPFSTFFAGTWNEISYNVDVASNSTISDFTFNADQKLISFTVSGLDGTVGFCRVTIPNVLLGGPYVILINGSPPLTLNDTSNGTLTFLYFTYNHSIHTVQIIGTEVVPEFPSTIILPLLMAFTMLSIIFLKKRKFKI